MTKSTKTKNWFKWPLMGLLLAAATAASALPVSISANDGPHNVDGTIVFTVSDSNPRGMCDSLTNPIFCFGGDFRFGFDPTKLSYDSFNVLSPQFEMSVIVGPVNTGGSLGAFIDVSVLPLPTYYLSPDSTEWLTTFEDVPTDPTNLFALTFKILAGARFTVVEVYPSVYLTDFNQEVPPTYSFDHSSATVEVTRGTIPEPTSYALVMLAFAAMGGVARRKGHRSA